MIRHLTANVPDGVLLQLATRAPKSVMYREDRIGLAFVRGRRAAYIDFAAIWQSEMTMDLIEAAGAMMVVCGGFHSHMTRDQAVENVIELRLLFDDHATQGFVRRAMKIDL